MMVNVEPSGPSVVTFTPDVVEVWLVAFEMIS